MALSYGYVYVAQVAQGASHSQLFRAIKEAEAYPGPSIIIAYSPCIAHGVDLSNNHRQQQMAVDSGHWPLLRYDPRRVAEGNNPLHLDSKEPSIPYRDYVMSETRFSMLWRSHPERAEAFLKQAQHEVNQRYHHYQQEAGLSVEEIEYATETEEKDG